MRYGYGLSYPRRARARPVAEAEIDLTRLFTEDGLVGGYWDVQDLSTLFADIAGTVPAAVGDRVARIDDKSGHNYHATQATSGSRPFLRQDGNGRYYLEFDGTDDRLVVAAAAQGLFQDAAKGFLLAAASTSTVAPGTTNVVMFWSAGANAIVRANLRNNENDLWFFGRRLDGDPTLSVSADDAAVADVPFTFSALVEWDLARVTVRKDGVEAAQSTSFQTPGNTSNTPSAYVYLGASPTVFWAGRCYGWMAIRGIPDAEQLADIDAVFSAMVDP